MITSLVGWVGHVFTLFFLWMCWGRPSPDTFFFFKETAVKRHLISFIYIYIHLYLHIPWPSLDLNVVIVCWLLVISHWCLSTPFQLWYDLLAKKISRCCQLGVHVKEDYMIWFLLLFVLPTLLKLTRNIKKNHRIEKENHLPNLRFVNFSGCTYQLWRWQCFLWTSVGGAISAFCFPRW